jgi:hypothetical protein
MNEKKTRVLAALLSAPNRASAAQTAGVDQRTLRRYMSDPEFSEALQAACVELVDDATIKAQAAMSGAVGVLEEISRDSSQTASSRIAAAKGLLEYGTRLSETSYRLRERMEDTKYGLF